MVRRRTRSGGGGKRSKSAAPVLMYTLPGCGACQRARTLLASRAITYDEVQGVPSIEFRQQLVSLAGSGTAPQLVIRGHAIGGASDLARLDRLGVLEPLVRGERFPRAFAQKRVSVGGLLRSGFGLFPGPSRQPHRYLVATLDEAGTAVERREVESAAAASDLAAELNARSV